MQNWNLDGRPTFDDYADAGIAFSDLRDRLRFVEERYAQERLKDLTQRLTDDQQDTEARIELIAHSMRRQDGEYWNHLGWIIANCPTHPILEAIAPLTRNEKQYRAILSLWNQLCLKHSKNVVILSHAAWFWSQRGFAHAEYLWKQCLVVEPENPVCNVRLSDLHRQAAQRGRGPKYREFAVSAVRYFREALKLDARTPLLVFDMPLKFELLEEAIIPFELEDEIHWLRNERSERFSRSARDV